MSETTINLLGNGLAETLFMTFISGLLGFVLGLPAGVLLFMTRRGQPAAHRTLHAVLSMVVNIFRAIPFLILIVWIIPFTRMLVGTSIGVSAALVPLSVGAAPFIARLVENSLLEVPQGLVESARAMGATRLQIVSRVLLPEALPSLVHNVTVTLVMLVGYSAMGGAVGAGGLGQVGYQYGYIGYDAGIMNSVLALLILLVFLIQLAGDFIAKKINRR